MTTVHAQTGIKLATKPAKTSLLGGHFIYKVNNTPDAPTPSSANVVEWVDDDPTLWRHNVHIGSNGIKLRYGETTLSKWDTDSLIFYIPTTTNGITTTTKGLQLSSTGLEIFGSSQSTADVTVNSSGIKLVKGGLEAGTKNTSDYIYLWSNDDSTNHTITIGSGSNKSDWRIVAGTNFGVDKAGNLYASNANIAGIINANTGTIGGSSGWTISSQKIASSGTPGQAGTMYLNTASTSESIAINEEAARTDWMLTIGDKFGVTSDGYLHADGLNITNINASSLNIGPVVRYGTCATTAATRAKVVNNVSGFSLINGSMITVTFTNGNSDTAPTLNINDTGVKTIMKPGSNGLEPLTSYEYNLSANSVRTFMYVNDSTNDYWVLQDDGAGVAQNSATNAYNYASSAYNYANGYITSISGIDGINVRRYGDSSNFVNIRDDGVHIYKTINNVKTDVAFFGETARIGQVDNNKSRVEIKETGIDFYNKTSGEDVTLAHIGYAKGTASGGSTSTSKYPYYTFGERDSDLESTRGNYSVAEGKGITASGYASHAEGANTIASGGSSHAEGWYTIASGSYAHAEGYYTKAIGVYSHAEGGSTAAGATYAHAEGAGTTARASDAHAEGYYTTASGVHSHAQNYYTIAQRKSQTTIGEYNIADTGGTGETTRGNYAFIIGNGTSDSARSNALTVDWEGNVTAASEYYSRIDSLSLGTYIAVGFLTNSSGTLTFSIPTGRVFPSGTTISKITFNCVARSGSSSGAGKYIISASNGTSAIAIDSSKSSTIYNAEGTSKSITTAMWTKTLQGGTNIRILIETGSNNFFSGSSLNGNINNQPVAVYLTSIIVTLSLPTWA